MAKVLNRIWSGLSSIVRTDDAQGAPSNFDVHGSVQPVYDLSDLSEREASREIRASAPYQYGAQRPGLFVVEWTVVATGAGTFSTGLTVSTAYLRQFGLDRSKLDPWVVSIAGGIDGAGGFTDAIVSLVTVDTPRNTTTGGLRGWFPLFRSTSVHATSVAAGNPTSVLVPTWTAPFPLLVPDLATLEATITTTNAATWYFLALLQMRVK